MLDFTPEEKKIILFLLYLGFCGLILSNLIKAWPQTKKLVYPGVELAKVNLNKIGLEEIQRLSLIPPKIARQIIEYRNVHQKFTSLEELKNIKGIGPKRYEKLRSIFFIE